MTEPTPTPKHTPGPWTILHDPSTHAGRIRSRFIGPQAYSDDPSKAPAIASIWQDGKGADECNANERLIAAAPDLLAALRDLVDEMGLTLHVTGWDGSTTLRSLGRARAAIAKAEGKA